MKTSSVIYMMLGLLMVGIIYVLAIMPQTNLSLAVYIALGVTAFVILFYRSSRWPFIWGFALGLVIVVMLVRYRHLQDTETWLPF